MKKLGIRLLLLFLFVSRISCAQVYWVTSSADSGPGSIREAIEEVNLGNADTVYFNISPLSTDIDTIHVQSRLPSINRSVVIDATTESGFDTATYANVMLAYDSVDSYIFMSGCPLNIPLFYNAIEFYGSHNTVKGLGFYRFAVPLTFYSSFGQNEIAYNVMLKSLKHSLYLHSDSNHVHHNLIGIDASGTTNGNGSLFFTQMFCGGFPGYLYADSSSIQLIGDHNSFHHNKCKRSICQKAASWIQGDNNKIYNNESSEASVRFNPSPASPTYIHEFHFYENNQLELVNNEIGLGNAWASLSFTYCDSSRLFDNHIRSIAQVLFSNSNHNEIVDNTFGSDSTIDQGGGLLFFDSNQNSIKKNVFRKTGFGFAGGSAPGISCNAGSHFNHITENQFIGFNAPIYKAIVLNGGNQGKASPNIVEHIYTDDSLTLLGTGTPFDSVEIFMNTGSTQEAHVFIDKVLVSADSNWSYTIYPGSYFTPKANNFYIATASDSLGNTSELSKPDSLLYSICYFSETDILVPDTNVCPKQGVVLDGFHDNVNYQWSSANGLSSSDKVVTVWQTDTVFISLSDYSPCTIEDTMVITQDFPIAPTSFLMASKAGIDDDVVIIDITNPPAESSEWITNASQVDKDYYSLLSFSDTGKQNITLVTWIGSCSDSLTKEIHVLDTYESFDGSKMASYYSDIEEFNVFPNPSKGQFHLYLRLNVEDQMKVDIFEQSSAKKVFSLSLNKQKEHLVPITIPAPQHDIYVIYVSSSSDILAKKIIVDP